VYWPSLSELNILIKKISKTAHYTTKTGTPLARHCPSSPHEKCRDRLTGHALPLAANRSIGNSGLTTDC
jgi:hypothetical protein